MKGMKRAAAIGACVLAAFVFMNYFEFNYWFYNNEMPAYLRGGVLHGDAAAALQAYYEAARDACPRWRPQNAPQCQTYQIALLGHATWVRPVSSAFGLLLTWLSTQTEFMQALKLAIIALAQGSALLCGLVLLPFLLRLDSRALAAIGLVWVGGWLTSRPLHVAGPGVQLLVFALVVIGIALGLLRRYGLPSVVIKLPPRWFSHHKAPKIALQLLAIACCYAIGYHLHVRFESKFPLLYLALSLALWPLLYRAAAVSMNWVVVGLLSSFFYLASIMAPSFYDLSLSKQHQIIIAGMLLFIAIWRDDGRVFWALPLLLPFDMQNGARLAALVIVAECFVGLFRRRVPNGIVPAALVVVTGIGVTAKTAYYPFDERLYSLSDAIGVLTTPIVLVAGFVSLMVLWAVVDRRSPETAGAVAIDRILVYAASVAVMGGIQIPTIGLLFDSFQLSNLFRSVGVAPIIAIFFAAVGLLLTSYRSGTTDVARGSAFASMALLLLLTGTAQGRHIGFSQLGTALRASFSSYLPPDWSRRTPDMTLADNTVYYDVRNLETGALMQYSVIKILLLSRKPEFAREKLTILPFGERAR
jgi:hypothetical protein